MELITEGDKVPIFRWCKDIEKGAMDQAYNLSRLPFIHDHIALMSDAHQGYGMPVGGIAALKGVVSPNLVGVDIGCGVTAAKTNIQNISTENLKKIMGRVRQSIPLGFSHHKDRQIWEGFEMAPEIEVVQSQLSSAEKQLGTLGGGNHFIEFQQNKDGFLWIMIHSGSRNFGYKIAKHYNKVAQDLCHKWYSDIPTMKGEDGLAFLPIDTKEGKEYIEAMNFALTFAKESRRRMMDNCVCACWQSITTFTQEYPIDIHHNYATQENQFGKNVWVHRKGATSAKKDELGIIPGSQGTSSFIVKGKGNPKSFMSCSHGAGRKMSRTKARNILNLAEEQELLDKKGILHSIRNKNNLDEASSAYKDIQVVMQEQSDLVEIVERLEPLGVIKG